MSFLHVSKPELCVGAVAIAAGVAGASVEYERYELFELVASADVVVAGEITSVRVDPRGDPPQLGDGPPRLFDLRIERVIDGALTAKTITVHCFTDWTCATRWTPYEAGQRVLLCLAGAERQGDPYWILGAGDEGEMPLVDTSVCVRGFDVHGFETATQTIGGAQTEGPLVALSELEAGVRGFRSLYEAHLGERDETKNWIRPRAGADVAPFVVSSRFARHLHEQALSSGFWTGPIDSSAVRPFVASSVIGVQTAHSSAGAPLAGRDRSASESDSAFDESVASVGDVNGDGFDDLALGRPSARERHGAVLVTFLGARGELLGTTTIAEGENGLPAAADGRGLGSSVAAAGDIDRDGVPDVVVGARGGKDSRGLVWVLFLARDGRVRSAVEIAGADALLRAGVKQDSALGSSLACIGDLDRDGTAEIAIGQDPYFDITPDHGRSVFVASVDRLGVVRRAGAISSHGGGFTKGWSHFGSTLAALGDVDGDGVPDLAIADEIDCDGGTRRGALWIVFLNADGSVRAKQKISDWAGGFEGLLHDDAHFARALCSAGDADGDGALDLFVTSGEGLWMLSIARTGVVRDAGLVAPPEGPGSGLWSIAGALTVRPARGALAEPMLVLGGGIHSRPPSENELVQLLPLSSLGLRPRK